VYLEFNKSELLGSEQLTFLDQQSVLFWYVRYSEIFAVLFKN
jgi:hypothetical protein